MNNNNQILAKIKETQQPRKTLTPSNMEIPTFAMNIPFTLEVKEANNAWNEGIDPEDLIIDKEVSMSQFLDLYNYLSSETLVQLVPHYGKNLQDLTYVANLGVVLEHCRDYNIAIVSNFSSAPRYGETEIGEKWFKSLGYNTFICPYKFEGSADLKWLYGNVYIGQIGQRSERAAYNWMMENFNMEIILVEQNNDKLYHLDCSVFPLTSKDTMIATKCYSKEELREIEKHTNIIHIPSKYAEAGITNNVRCYNSILNASDIEELSPTYDKEDYRLERDKNIFLEDICSEFALEAVFIDQSESFKAGALLSCSVMELNRISYGFETI